MTTTTRSTSIASLRDGFAGDVLVPGDAGFDEARAVWNGMIDRTPAAVARCRGTADVVAAVRFAREANLEIAVRGGGHNVAGNATTDDGLIIDLSAMRAVHVDPVARRAVVQGGATLADYDRECQQFGLASTMGAISMTGVAGLTLGGGLGWLMRKHGLACDSLTGAQVVTASGEVLTVSSDSHPDLLWALRGGGGNFGVVTSLEFELHPVGPLVYGGLAAFPASRAAELLPAYREFVATADPELGINLLFLTAPPLPFVPTEVQFTPIIGIPFCWAGDLARGEQLAATVRSWGPSLDMLGPIPYVVQQTLVDAGFPAGRRSYWKSGYLAAPGEAALHDLCEVGSAIPSPFSIVEFQPLGGAVARYGADHAAFGNRDAAYLFNIVSVWEDRAEDEAQIAWTRSGFDRLARHGTGGVYVNYLTGEEGPARIKAAYGEQRYDRLVRVKTAHDPDNAFHRNQNITPA